MLTRVGLSNLWIGKAGDPEPDEQGAIYVVVDDDGVPVATKVQVSQGGVTPKRWSTGGAGPTGPTGPAGADGAPGAAGSQGIQGVQGVQGNPGTAGTNGTNGSQGPAGPAPSGTGFVRVTNGVLDPVVTTCPPSSHSHAESEVTNLVSDLAAKAATSDPRFHTTLEDSSAQRILMSTLAPGTAGFVLLTGVGYWVYLGRVTAAFTPKFVEFHVSTIGAGAQTAEVGFFSTPAAPNKANQTLTKLVSTSTVDALTTTGVKRNTSAFATSVAAGTHLWAGIRTAMATTQPTIWGLAVDMNQGQILSLAAAGALTGVGPWAGAKIAAGTAAACPDLRGTLD